MNNLEIENKLDKIIELLEKIYEQNAPITYTWKLKDYNLINKYFFNKLNYKQKADYINMIKSIANQHNVLIDKLYEWPTAAYRHLFYTSCKWIGVKEGHEKKRLSNLIFTITSNKPENSWQNENNQQQENINDFFAELNKTNDTDKGNFNI